MSGEKDWLIAGQISYWLLVAVVVSLVLAGFAMYIADAVHRSEDWVTTAINVGSGLVAGKWITAVLVWLYHHPGVLALVLTPLALAYVLELMVDYRLDRRYSEFWHGIRRLLRKLLGF